MEESKVSNLGQEEQGASSTREEESEPSMCALFEKMMESDRGLDEIEKDKTGFYDGCCGDYNITNIVNWYHRLKRFTIRTKFVKLSEGFVNYLKNEDLHLPEGIETTAFTAARKMRDDEDGMSWEDGFSDEDEDEEQVEFPLDPEGGIDGTKYSVEKNGSVVYPQGIEEFDVNHYGPPRSIEMMTTSVPVSITPFEALNKWITDTVKKLGGSGFPKLNWKAPKDAQWIAYNKSLRCYLPGDVYLLFKSSGTISNVLDLFPKSCRRKTPLTSEAKSKGYPSGQFLILREWKDISPDTEFRCFVMNDRLVAISQRDVSCSYPSIQKYRDGIIMDIYLFFTKIQKLVGLQHFVFDVIRDTNKVILVDLNPFCVETDPCLFTYDDLLAVYNEMMHRCIQEAEEAQSRNQPLPKEIKDKAGNKLPWTDLYGEPSFRFIDKRAPHPFINTGPRNEARLDLNKEG